MAMSLYAFNRANTIWTPLVSVALTAIAAVSVFYANRSGTPSPTRIIPVLTIFAAILFLPGIRMAGVDEERRISRRNLLRRILERPANAITILRFVLICIGTTIAVRSPKIAAILVTTGFSTDFVDGALARREARNSNRPETEERGTSRSDSPAPGNRADTDRQDIPVERRIGPWLDAESDALALYLAGVVAWNVGYAPSFLLVPVTARYLFGLFFSLFPLTPDFPGWYRWYSKGVAALLQVTVGLLWISGAFGVVDVATTTGGTVLTITTVLIGASFLLEFLYRLGTLLRLLPKPFRRGLLKSYLVYYSIPFRTARAVRFYRQIVPSGSLVFDIGAHIGNRIRYFDAVPARRTVACEPQPACRPLLNHWYGDRRNVDLLPIGVGSREGELPIWTVPEHPTLSSLNEEWIHRMESHPRFRGIRWKESGETVPVKTLDGLIGTFGTPYYIKIDVEGFEEEVLKGLSSPVPMISFEYLPMARDRTLDCLALVDALAPGAYRFNRSIGETMRFTEDRWLDRNAMETLLTELRDDDRSGDVYARRFDGA